MRVNRTNETHFVDWRYENPDLETLLEVNGISVTEYHEHGGREIMRRLNEGRKEGDPRIGSLPAPLITVCILRKEDGSKIAEASVRKYKHTAYNYADARKYSLKKLLESIFPGRDNRVVRKEYWEAYLGRNKKNEPAAPLQAA